MKKKPLQACKQWAPLKRLVCGCCNGGSEQEDICKYEHFLTLSKGCFPITCGIYPINMYKILWGTSGYYYFITHTIATSAKTHH